METNKSVKRMDDLLKRKGKTRTWAVDRLRSHHDLRISVSTVSRWFSRGSDPHSFIENKIKQLIAHLEKMEDAKDE